MFMNRAAALLLAIAFVSFALARYAHAQALISIDSSVPLNEGFDGIGSDVPSQLPTGWVVSSGTAFDLGRSHVEKSAGTSGLSQV